MGAQYIDGACAANPIFNLACQEKLLASPIRRPEPFRGMFYASDGRAIDIPVSITAYHTFRQIEQEAAMLFNMGSGREHGTMLHFLNIRIQQELHNFPEDQRYDAARVMYGLTNAVRARCGDDLSLVSADQYGSYISIPGGKIRIPLGYVGVIAPLLRDLPSCSLHYCKPVNKISWGALDTPGKRAVVHSCDGEQFPADYVIVTCSLGVLKEHANELFSPSLPSEKTDAIRNLGYGMVNKIFLEYRRPFWAWKEGSIKFAWSPEELSNRKDWLRGLSAIDEVEGSKHVLCAYVSGPEAAQMELISDEETAQGITNILRQFTGDCTLPFPKTILRSKWSTDPYFCGAFSYMSTESTIRHQCELSAPLPGPSDQVSPVLLFAGEATCVGHYSTVHGARLSGIREAERIIQLTKKHGGPPPAEKKKEIKESDKPC